MFMNKLLPDGMAAATVRAMRCLASAGAAVECTHAPVKALEHTGVRQALDVAPHRLQGGVKTLGQGFDFERAVFAHRL
jgi:hypothetical protein